MIGAGPRSAVRAWPRVSPSCGPPQLPLRPGDCEPAPRIPPRRSPMLSISGSGHAIASTAAADWQSQAATQPLDAAANRAPVADGVARMLQAAGSRGGEGPVAAPTDGGRELVASEDSVTAGGVRAAYDMQLYREADGSYTLEMDMKVEFDFTEG